MIWLFLAIETAECNVWCISENFEKGSYNLSTRQCECADCFDYDLIKLRKKKAVKKSEQLEKMEIYEPFDDSPYLKIK